MRFPIVIEPGDATTAYGVIVPDLAGCFSAGDTMDEAMDNASEAIALYLEESLLEGKALPQVGSLENHRSNPDYEGWIWAMVDVDLSKLESEVKRVNISVPARVLGLVDIAAHQAGRNRSQFLYESAVLRIERELPCP